MKPAIEFLRTTLLGGLFVILPIALAALLTLKAVAAVAGLLKPIAVHLPGGVVVEHVLAAVVVLGGCFVTGLVVRTRAGRRLNRMLESAVLERLPGYTLLRSVSRRVAGDAEGNAFAAALVEIEEGLVPAFVVEEHPDGRFTVFVPAVPTPTVGAVYILAAARVHRIDVPFASLVKCVTRWGAGSGELLEAMARA